MEELTENERARRRLTAQVMQLAEELRAIDRQRIETTGTAESAAEPAEERLAEPPRVPTEEEEDLMKKDEDTAWKDYQAMNPQPANEGTDEASCAEDCAQNVQDSLEGWLYEKPVREPTEEEKAAAAAEILYILAGGPLRDCLPQ